MDGQDLALRDELAFLRATLDKSDQERSDLEIELQAADGVLQLSGVRETPAPEDACGPVRMHLMEIDHGDFSRTVNLPSDVDHKAIDAVYKGGFLRIQIPKK